MVSCFFMRDDDKKCLPRLSASKRQKSQNTGALTSPKLKPHIKPYYHFEIFGHAKTKRQVPSKKNSVISLVPTALLASQCSYDGTISQFNQKNSPVQW